MQRFLCVVGSASFKMRYSLGNLVIDYPGTFCTLWSYFGSSWPPNFLSPHLWQQLKGIEIHVKTTVFLNCRCSYMKRFCCAPTFWPLWRIPGPLIFEWCRGEVGKALHPPAWERPFWSWSPPHGIGTHWLRCRRRAGWPGQGCRWPPLPKGRHWCLAFHFFGSTAWCHPHSSNDT